MTIRLTLLFGTFAAILLTTTTPQKSEACSPPLDSIIDEGQLISGIPTRGVVPIRYSEYTDFGLNLNRAEVFDAAGDLVEGSVGVGSGRIVWRAASPLDPDASYTIEIETESEWRTIEFRTASSDVPVALPEALGAAELRESFRFTERVCCADGGDTSCGPTQSCFNLAYERHFTLSTTVTADELTERFFSVETTATGALEVGNQSARFVDTGAATYCMQVTLSSLLDDSTLSQQLCAPVLERSPLPGSDDVDLFSCEGPLVNPETGEKLSGGCNSSGHGGTPALVLIALVGLAWRRRRV